MPVELKAKVLRMRYSMTQEVKGAFDEIVKYQEMIQGHDIVKYKPQASKIAMLGTPVMASKLEKSSAHHYLE